MESSGTGQVGLSAGVVDGSRIHILVGPPHHARERPRSPRAERSSRADSCRRVESHASGDYPVEPPRARAAPHEPPPTLRPGRHRMGRIFETRKATMFARWDKMSKAHARIGKEITIAVKKGGPNPDSNPSLRRVIQNARAVNRSEEHTPELQPRFGISYAVF